MTCRLVTNARPSFGVGHYTRRKVTDGDKFATTVRRTDNDKLYNCLCALTTRDVLQIFGMK